MIRILLLAALVIVAAVIAPQRSSAQERRPTAAEMADVRDCAAKHADDIDEAERQCVFHLVADPCAKRSKETNADYLECYRVEHTIWDDLLNENYKALRDDLDEQQRNKAREMQQAWIADRDRTCDFYYDKIQGTMGGVMGAACRTRETARRALLLAFFRRL